MMTQKRMLALSTLIDCGVEVGSDFHTLRSSHVDALLEHAKRWRYRKPRNANGSRARYFHAMLQRRATDKFFRGFIR